MRMSTRTSVTAEIVIAAAVAIAVCVLATPTRADQSAFSTLSSKCKGAPTARVTDQRDEVNSGIRDGYQAWELAHPPRDNSAAQP